MFWTFGLAAAATLLATLAFGAWLAERARRHAAEVRANDLNERLICCLAATHSERVWATATRGPACAEYNEQLQAEKQVWAANFASSD